MSADYFATMVGLSGEQHSYRKERVEGVKASFVGGEPEAGKHPHWVLTVYLKNRATLAGLTISVSTDEAYSFHDQLDLPAEAFLTPVSE